MLRSILRPNHIRLATSARLASTATAKPITNISPDTPLSVPSLRKLNTRWNTMTEVEKNELISALSERQKADWKTLTPLEKQAAWYISYGEWGPRTPIHPKGTVQKIVLGVLTGIAVSGLVFLSIRAVLPEKPKTMSQEWQQASNEELEKINAEPFSGYDQIQSPIRGVHPSEDDE